MDGTKLFVRIVTGHRYVSIDGRKITVKVVVVFPCVIIIVGNNFVLNALDLRFVCMANTEITAKPVEGHRSACMIVLFGIVVFVRAKQCSVVREENLSVH